MLAPKTNLDRMAIAERSLIFWGVTNREKAPDITQVLVLSFILSEQIETECNENHRNSGGSSQLPHT